jgi:hypothetical protein
MISTLIPTNKKKSSCPTDININSNDYPNMKKNNVIIEDLFLQIYKGVFATDETESLNKAFNHDKTIHVTIFARKASFEKSANKKAKTKLIKYSDILIAEATYLIDSSKSVFLNWLVVLDIPLSDLKIHEDFIVKNKEDNVKTNPTLLLSIRKQYGIGRFLLLIGQLFKSIIATYWCPIICQVHKGVKTGPFIFYVKSYFIQVDDYHQLVHDQYIIRSQFVMPDPNLVWMVLFQPLLCLLNTDIIDKNDRPSFKKIIVRGYYYFLNHFKDNNNIFHQSNIHQNLEKIFDNNELIRKPPILSIKQIDTKEFGIHDGKYYADDDVAVQILNSNKKYEDTIDLKDCGSGPRENDGSCMFICISKLMYGTSTYYRGIRQFFYYFYKNVSLLATDHEYFSDFATVSIVNDLALRYFTKDNSLPKVFKDDNNLVVTAEHCKKFMAKICYKFLMKDFWGSFPDLSLLTSIYQTTFVVFQATSPMIPEILNGSMRNWNVSFMSTENGLEYARSYIKPKKNLILESNIKWMCLLFNKHYVLFSQSRSLNELPYEDDYKLKDNYGCWFEKREIISVDSPPKAVQNIDDSISMTDSLISYEIHQNGQKLDKQFDTHVSFAAKTKIIGIARKRIFNEDRDIGPMFTFAELSIGIDMEFIMPVTRSLMPHTILNEFGITPFGDGISFVDLLKFRPNTWISESATKPFID